MAGMNAAPSMSKSEQDYRCEEDHRTLTRAEEIRSDPKRMAGVQRHHRKTTRALSRVGKAIGAGRRTGRA